MSNIIEITDFNAPELDIYARLSENELLNRHEPEKGLFIAESPLVIERALDNGYIPVSMLVENKHIDTQARGILERCGDVPVYTAEFDILTNLTGFKLTRGMLCAMKRPPLKNPEEICANTKRIAILEDVMNPTNVGAIMRSAAALNIDAVLLTSSCSNPLYRRAIRVSMGTVFQIPWTFIPDEHNSYVEYIKSLGFKTAAMALCNNTLPIDAPVLNEIDRLAIILGTEGEGLKKETIEACDYTIKIPMANGVDSLNVAAASAVAFWQLGIH